MKVMKVSSKGLSRHHSSETGSPFSSVTSGEAFLFMGMVYITEKFAVNAPLRFP